MIHATSIVPYDPEWPATFTASADEIAAALGQNLSAIHHIGSTSIPGMHAKPVIDMLAVVGDLAKVDAQSPRMESLGYEVMGEFGIPGRRYFRRDNAAGVRTHQLHAFQAASPHIARHLAFRDFLRVHPIEAEEYVELKRRLAAEHPSDMNAYMDGKDGFIKIIEARALRWAAASRRVDQPSG